MSADLSSAALALDVSCRIAAAGAAIGAAEQWSVRSSFRPGGILAVPAHRMTTGRRRLTTRHTADALILAQAATAVLVLLLGTRSAPGWAALCLLAVAFVGLRWYRSSGGDGADQMFSIVFVAGALVAPAFPGDARIALGAGFVAAQALLSYAASGVAKLISPVWRDGTGLAGILSAVDHGTPALGMWLARHPVPARIASWGTIAFECGFVLVLVLPAPLGVALLAAGVGFHLACAVFMGLDAFLFAFPATYPCVLFAAALVRP